MCACPGAKAGTHNSDGRFIAGRATSHRHGEWVPPARDDTGMWKTWSHLEHFLLCLVQAFAHALRFETM